MQSPSVMGRPRHTWWDRKPGGTDGSLSAAHRQKARRQRVEAVLLLAREPLNSRKLAHHARLADGTEARTLVGQLNQLYDEAGRAFRVEEVAGGFRLLTRPHFAPWLRRLEHIPPQVRLSAPAMETLAVVAYRQPVLRAEIEAIRGVGCGEILRQLMDRDLVRIGGRSDELGRPYLYMTTKRFLQLFGLQNLDQLPRAFVLRNAGCPTDQTNGSSAAPMSTDPQPQEQEKSEVSVTSPTQPPVDEIAPIASIASEGNFDDDAEFADGYEEVADDDLDDDGLDDEEEFDDEDDEDDEDDDDELDDDLDDDQWEDVEDDDDELEEEWDDDDAWDKDYDDDEDDDEDDEDGKDGKENGKEDGKEDGKENGKELD